MENNADYDFHTHAPVFLIWDCPQAHALSYAEFCQEDGDPTETLTCFLKSYIRGLPEGSILIPPEPFTEEDFGNSGDRGTTLQHSGYVLQCRQRYRVEIGVPIPRVGYDNFIELDVDGRPIMRKTGVTIFEFKFIVGTPVEKNDGEE
jgi:hypothetical protein